MPDRRKRRLVGVLGGLGPEASALLLKLIVDEGARAGAVHDHEHPSVIVYVKPELPNSRRRDGTFAIIDVRPGRGDDAINLSRVGARGRRENL